MRGRPLRPRRERSRAGVQVRGHQFRLLHTSGGLTYGARTRGSHGPTSCLREHKGQSPPLRPQAPSCEEAQTPVWAAAATESLCGPDAAGGQAVLSPRSGGGATPRVLPGGAAESPGREPECGRAGRRPGRDALVRSRSRRPGPGGGGSDLAQNARPSWGGGAWWGQGEGQTRSGGPEACRGRLWKLGPLPAPNGPSVSRESGSPIRLPPPLVTGAHATAGTVRTGLGFAG